MSRDNLAVPGALLRTAGDGLTGEVDDLDPVPSARVPDRSHWYDGAVPALVVLGLLGAGVVPALGIAVVVLALVVIVVGGPLAPGRARGEEPRLPELAGLPAAAPLAPPVRIRLTATAGRVARRRGVRDFSALSAVVGCACFAVPLFVGRI